MLQKKKQRKKVVLEYESFMETKLTRPMIMRIGKTLAGNSVKRGRQGHFVAKKPYLDHSLCWLIYKDAKHLNVVGEHCHGTMVSGFRYALGAGISKEMKLKIAQMHHMGYHLPKSCTNTPKRFVSWPCPTDSSHATQSCYRLTLGTFFVRR